MPKKMTAKSIVDILRIASGEEALMLVEGLQNGSIEVDQDTTWESVVDQIARALKCLPSAFPENQEHLFRRIAELKADAGIGDA